MKNDKEGDTVVVQSSAVTQLNDFNEVSKVSDSYIPEGFKSQEEYLEDVRQTYELDLQADDSNRRQAVEDKAFAAGEQWDPIVLEHRKGLPCLVINSVPQFTAQLVGDWRSNRNGVKVVPSENGDTDIASIRSDLIRNIEMESRATRVYDSAFESMIQSGDGAFQISVEYAADDVFDQEIRIRPIDDSLSVVWDRMSIDPTGRDAMHLFVDERMPRKEFDANWPDCSPSELSETLTRDLRSGGWVEDDTVRVTAHWRILERNRLLMMFKDGQIIAMTDDVNLDDMIEKHGPPQKSRIAPCRYAQMHIVTGFEILSGPFEYKIDRLPVVRMTGRVVSYNGRRVRHGLVRFMKDPVRLKNFWRSVAAEQLGYAPKAQWIAPESAVEGRENDFRKAHLSRDPLLIYNDDATAPPERVDPPAIQQALLNEAQTNSQDMKDVTGIHDASLGIQGNETSGKAINARQREGDIASLTYYDNGNAAILEGGDIINQLIGQIYDSTRTIRVIGENEAAKMVRINDPYDPEAVDLSVGKYDVAISTGPSYTTRRVEAADAMMQAIQVWPQLIQVAGDIVAKAQDWPGAQELGERLRKTIPPQLLEGEKDEHGQPIQGATLDPQAVQQAAMEAHGQIQQLSAENEQLKQGAALKMEELKVKMFDAETKRMAALGQIAAFDKDRVAATNSMADRNPD